MKASVFTQASRSSRREVATVTEISRMETRPSPRMSSTTGALVSSSEALRVYSSRPSWSATPSPERPPRYSRVEATDRSLVEALRSPPRAPPSEAFDQVCGSELRTLTARRRELSNTGHGDGRLLGVSAYVGIPDSESFRGFGRSRSFWNEHSQPIPAPPRSQSFQDIWNRPASFFSGLWGFQQQTVEPKADPFLVRINVLGSPGTLRLLVDRKDSVRHTIDCTLRKYAAERRLPELRATPSQYGLYWHGPDFEVLDSNARIGQTGARQFHLFDKGIPDPPRQELALSHKGIVLPSNCRLWDHVLGMQSWFTSAISTFSRAVSLVVSFVKPWKFQGIACSVLFGMI